MPTAFPRMAERPAMRHHALTDQADAVVIGTGTNGATSLWEDILDYVRARPNDPRFPEALYRLICVARWGGGHKQLGKRAFLLLHSRYPQSLWTRQSR